MTSPEDHLCNEQGEVSLRALTTSDTPQRQLSNKMGALSLDNDEKTPPGGASRRKVTGLNLGSPNKCELV